jgi:hypothetical protein
LRNALKNLDIISKTLLDVPMITRAMQGIAYAPNLNDENKGNTRRGICPPIGTLFGVYG